MGATGIEPCETGGLLVAELAPESAGATGIEGAEPADALMLGCSAPALAPAEAAATWATLVPPFDDGFVGRSWEMPAPLAGAISAVTETAGTNGREDLDGISVSVTREGSSAIRCSYSTP